MLEIYLKELEKLNEYQKKAVTTESSYCLLNAAVGSGKTTVLMHKVLFLHYVKNIPLEDMMVLTFTNKAAIEIKERLKAFDEELNTAMKYFGTFHSVARNILEENENLEKLGYDKNFSIINSETSGELLESIIQEKSLNIKYKQKLIKRVEEFKKGKKLYGVMKNIDDIDELVLSYKKEKIKKNIMDFDDIIDNCISVLNKPIAPKYIILDEFQDTDDRQYKLIKVIAGPETKIFAIGDPNQIIYSWRTGTTEVFRNFIEDYKPETLTLPINYRSSKTITEAASALIAGNKVTSNNDYGSLIIIKKHHDAFNEALYISKKIKELLGLGYNFSDFAVLYRRQLQGELLKDVFEKEVIPSDIVFKRNNTFEENISTEVIPKVSLVTLHGAKGLEFTNVFIVGANMGNIPLTTNRKDEEEELRLFYVGITRAKKYLEISYLGKPDLPNVKPFISPYISLMPANLLSKDDENNSKSLKEIMQMLKEEMKLAKEKEKELIKKAKHQKYGEGIIIFENDDIIKVDFKGYGEKEFSKLFCPLTFLE